MNVESVEQLIEEFESADPAKRVSILKRIQIPKSEFEDFASWDSEDYTRNCIYRNDDFELLLLCWEIGVETPIHGHAGQDCWVFQVSGEVTETRYEKDITNKLITTNNMKLKEGKLAYMHDRMGFHRISNTGEERAMTLHVYASPIDRCSIFDPELKQFIMKEMTYDTIDGKEVRITGS